MKERTESDEVNAMLGLALVALGNLTFERYAWSGELAEKKLEELDHSISIVRATYDDVSAQLQTARTRAEYRVLLSQLRAIVLGPAAALAYREVHKHYPPPWLPPA